MYLKVNQKECLEARENASFVEIGSNRFPYARTMRNLRNSLARKLLLLLAMYLPHTVLAQNAFISPEIKPYVEFIKNTNTSPVDYIMGLFEKFDVVVIGERDHRDTTQYTLIQKIISDPRFIEKVGNVLTEVGVYNMRYELNRVLQADYQNNSDFEKALAEVNFNLQWVPLWEKTNYIQLQRDIYNVNKNLPAHQRISMYPTDIQFSWELNHTTANHQSFRKALQYRDFVMGHNAIDALYKIFAEPRKKALVIYNIPHSAKFHEDTEGFNHFAYQIIYDHFPGRVANVALNWCILPGFNKPYAGLTNEGKWDAAFAAVGNKSIGFDLAGTIFGDDIFDLHPFAERHAYKDVFHGFIFYKPASEWVASIGVPIFRHLDRSYVRNELARRFQIFQGIPELPEEFKDQLYEYAITLNIFNIAESQEGLLQLFNSQIEQWYKPN